MTQLQQRHQSDIWPRETIYPANGSPEAEPSPGTMGTAVRNRGCTGSCHGNMVASSAGCQQESVHQLLLFLEPWFHQSFLHIQQTCIGKAAQGDFLNLKINWCSQPKSRGSSAAVRSVSSSLTKKFYIKILTSGLDYNLFRKSHSTQKCLQMSVGQWTCIKIWTQQH